METEEGIISKTVFFRFRDVTKKAGGNFADIEDLISIARTRFEGAELDDIPDGSIAFFLEDRQFKVTHKLESIDDLYDGAVLELHVNGDADAQKRKRDVSTKEPGPKRQRVDSSAADDGKCICRLRGLPFKISMAELEEFFSGCDIATGGGVHICTNVAGRNTGDAFVQFANEESVALALAKDKQTLGHRYIDITRSNEAERRRAERHGRAYQGPASADSLVVRLRGLPFACDEEGVAEFLADVPLTAVHLVSDRQGRFTGEAFAELADESAQQQALRKHKHYIGERYVEVFSASLPELTAAFTGAHTGPTFPNSVILRMRGVPFSATKQQCKEFFTRATPLDVHLVTEPGGRSKGEAFAEFANETDANLGMHSHKSNMGTRYIELYRSSAMELTAAFGPAGAGPRGGTGQFGHFGGDRMGGFGVMGHGDGFHGSMGVGQGLGQGFFASSTCVEMKGLPFNASDGDIAQFLSAAFVSPLRVHRRSGGGFACVEFGSQNEAARALSLHKMNMGHRYIEMQCIPYSKMAELYNVSSSARHGSGGRPNHRN